MNSRQLAIAALVSLPGSLFAQNLLDNGGFQTDISGWTITGSPEITVNWTAFGNPSGGLEMLAVGDTQGAISAEAQTPCLTLEGGEHLITGDTYPQGLVGTGFCGVNRLRYFNTTCSGGPASNDAFTNAEATWTTLTGPLTVHDPDGDSFKIVLTMTQPGAGSGSRGCTFDNIALFGPTPSSLEIPTADARGLTALALAAAVLGMAAIRRARRTA